jgi:hypothetical protein
LARVACPAAAGGLEDYAAQFDGLFSRLAQRRGFRDYLTGLLAPRDRNKTLTGLAGAEPVAGAQHAAVQRLQYFLSESTWDSQKINDRRVELLLADPATAPHAHGVLAIDDSGDRKDGRATAHVGRQWLGRYGKTDNGIVTVTTLSTNCGSVDSFQVCTAWGLSPNARQIRDTVDCDMPVAAAIDRVDQCVSCPGVSSSVLVITCSTRSSPINRGRPGRGSSDNPSSRPARNRDRHLDTMSRDTPNSAATCPMPPPSAQRNTIRDRAANACAVLRRRAHPASTERSCSDSTTGSSFGLGTATPYSYRRTTDSGH